MKKQSQKPKNDLRKDFPSLGYLVPALSEGQWTTAIAAMKELTKEIGRKNPEAKKTITQAGDRKRILAAIQAEQKHIDLDAATELANREADKVYSRMVEGKDLKGLCELDRIFKELKGSFKRSEAFSTIRYCLKDRIDDYESGCMDEEAKAGEEVQP